MEDLIAVNPCTVAPQGDPDRCPFIPVCPVHEAWRAARQALIATLSQTTFDKLAVRGSILAHLTPEEAPEPSHPPTD